jgi:hypothetical protein
MPRPSLRTLLLLSSFVASCGLFVAGCGAGANKSSAPFSAEPAPQAPATSSAEAEKAEEPATLEEAEVALSRAQTELDSALGPVAFAAPPAQDQASGSAAPAPAPAAEPKAGAPAEERAPSPSKAQRTESEASRAEGASKKEASDCALACRAFQSLNRAVDAVCRLDSGGERCSRARRVAADAQARVASCSCQAP